MKNNLETNDLFALFLELNDGTITAEKHQLLESILREDSQARRQWFLFCDLETGLRDSAALEESKRTLSLPSIEIAEPSRPISRTWIMSVAAMLLLVLSLAAWFFRPSSALGPRELAQSEAPVSEVAVLTHSVDPEWIDNSSHPVGSTLAPSTIAIRSGALLIEFFSGATVVLEGPTEFQVLSSTKGRLISGKLNAHVPRQAQGFTISTADGEIVDLGTDFGLSLLSDAGHELHVFQGKVEVQSTANSLFVETGEAIRLDSESPPKFAANRSKFLAKEELIERSKNLADQRFAQWRNKSLSLSSTPEALYHLRMDAAPTNPANRGNRLPNDASGAGPQSTAHLVGCQWVAGRWPDKHGILLDGPSDRIRIDVPQSMQSVTLMAWVNIRSLPRWQHSLLSSDSETPGSIHWQLSKLGQLRFAIARDLGKAQSDWEAVESQPFLTEDRLREWILLSTTFDGVTIRHYANGQPIGSGTSYKPDTLHIGTSDIGNWLGDTRRELHAIIDEFVVLDRVLNEQEIAEIYDYGRP